MVAISGDYSWPCLVERRASPPGRDAAALGFSQHESGTGEDARHSIVGLLHLLGLGRRAQVLLHRDFKIHQLIAFPVVHSHQVEAGAS